MKNERVRKTRWGAALLSMVMVTSLLPKVAGSSQVRADETEVLQEESISVESTELLIDETNFPDAGFRKVISRDCDSDKSGSLSQSEIAAVRKIDVFDDVYDLKGIEFFTVLEYLNNVSNADTLDLSKNTSLVTLWNNDVSLTTLILGNNPNLRELICPNGQFTSLSIGGCPKLVRLIKDSPLEYNSGMKLWVSSQEYGEESCTVWFNNEISFDMDVVIDETTFPDANFRSFVSAKFDKDSSGTLSASEIDAVKIMNCSDMDISDLTGIEFFVEVEDMSCANTQVTKLDVSANMKLRELLCCNCNLTSLSMNANPDLIYLDCTGNSLTEIDISACPLIKELLHDDPMLASGTDRSCVRGYGSDVRALFVDVDVVVFTSDADIVINEINFPDAVFRNLISKFDSDNSLAFNPDELDAVTTIDCSEKSITDLKGIEFFTNLEKLQCFSNQLTYLDISKNKELYFLSCYDNPMTNLVIESQKLSLLLKEHPLVPLSGQPILYSKATYEGILYALYVGDNVLVEEPIPINETTFPDKSFRAAVSKQCDKDKSASLSQSEIAEVKSLYLEAKGIQDLTGIDYFTYLEVLECDYNPLDTLDLSGKTTIKRISCTDCSLTTLNVSGCTSLEDLECSENSLTSLDVSNITTLKKLVCVECDLTALNVNGCSSLGFLHCDYNSLTSLDVSGCTSLKSLEFRENPIESVNLNGCISLSYLSCRETKLSSLDLSGCPKLSTLDCTFCQFASLDVSACPELTKLSTYGNQISQLNLRYCPLLLETFNIGEKQVFSDTGLSYNYLSWQFVALSYDLDTEIVNKPINCTVGFDANGGSGAMTAVDVEKGTAYTLPANGFTAPAGKEFDKWDVGNPGESIVISADITIKAIWKDIPATPEPQPDTPTPEPAKDPSFEDFVERLYTVALGRASEPEGKAFWVEQVVKNGFTGADCARFFMLGAPEFLGRNLTDDQFVEVLYKTYFDRDSEPDGKAYWMGRLASGTERAVLVEEFIESVEWCNVCATYGVKSGALYHKATIPSKNAVKFATRLYTCCLGRDPEAEGLEYWALALTNLDATGYQAASLFFTLPEFVGLKTTNEEYLTRLYTTFMGREPEAEGFAYWLGLLNGGTDRNDVMKAFAGCPEFQEICNQYGIVRGEI
ncbi:MAG: DUF4214 domain-containing protein [Clostridiales bacterium]|nr:DUF4214 domain-containing protein [Clostridiales bacterium]